VDRTGQGIEDGSDRQGPEAAADTHSVHKSREVGRRYTVEGEIGTWHEREAVEEAIPDVPRTR
jgi:hypothetical protein